MSYLIELQTQTGVSSYVIADGGSREEALAQVEEQIAVADAEEKIVVLSVHTVH